MITCYRCAKTIKGQAILTTPPIYEIKLGINFPKAFHPSCYKKAEIKAAKELRIEFNTDEDGLQP